MSNFSIDIEDQRVWIGREIYVLCVRGVDKPEPKPYTIIPITKEIVPLLEQRKCKVLEFSISAIEIVSYRYELRACRNSFCNRNKNVLSFDGSTYRYNWFFDKEDAERQLHELITDIKIPASDIPVLCGNKVNDYLDDLGILKDSVPDIINRFLRKHPGCVSDGYHTFNELYNHRAALFAALVALKPELAWKSKYHHDGTFYDGMFIVGMHLPIGDITYHYDIDPWWDMFCCKELDNAPEFDGHTPNDVIARLLKYAKLLSVEK